MPNRRNRDRIQRIIDSVIEQDTTIITNPAEEENVPATPASTNTEGRITMSNLESLSTGTIIDGSTDWYTTFTMNVSQGLQTVVTTARIGGSNAILGHTNSIEDAEMNDSIKDEQLVVATDKKKYPRSECWFSGKQYFHKSHRDVVIDPIDGRLIHKDYSIPIIGKLSVVDGKAVIEDGWTHSKHTYVTIPIQSGKLNISGRIADLSYISGWDYRESLDTGIIVDADYKDRPISTVKIYDQFKNYHTNVKDVKQALKLGMISPSYTITEGLRYTFGVELEMSRGFLPNWKAAKYYNVSCVRDGSVNPGEEQGGPEIVTGVLVGDTGINHLQEICLELSKRTKVNASCGVHLHIGNVNFNSKFLVNSYRLALFLEEEIFSTLPYSRRKNIYCKPLKSFNFRPAIGDTKENLLEIEEDYNTLFKYISYEKANNPSFDFNKGKQHPMGAKCSYNRETPRYCWLNYVPAMFNTRNNGSYSLEIRNHSATTNFTKVKNWLLFFMAFVAFAERYPELINSSITMSDVINKIYPKKAKSLIMYFNNRKALFADEDREKEEYKQVEESKKTIKELINN